MATTLRYLGKKPKYRDAVLLTGLPGIGLVGKIALDHMLSKLKTERVAEVYSDAFPPSVRTQDAVLELIKDDVHHARLGGRDMLFLAGPVQPTLDFRAGSAQEHYEFAQAIAREAKSMGVTEAYTLAGISVGEARTTREPRVIIAATDKKVLAEFKKHGVVVDKSEGLISGAAGLILGAGKQMGLSGACLMGETDPKLVYGDHGSAQKILELLMKRFGFKMDLSELEKESKQVQAAFAKLNKQLAEQQHQHDEAEGGMPTYVR